MTHVFYLVSTWLTAGQGGMLHDDSIHARIMFSVTKGKTIPKDSFSDNFCGKELSRYILTEVLESITGHWLKSSNLVFHVFNDLMVQLDHAF